MYSRQRPSKRYQQLVEMYRNMHQHGEQFLQLPPEKTFPGFNIERSASRIKEVTDRIGVDSMLDYGSGKGVAWSKPMADAEGNVHENLKEYLKLTRVRCYDPGHAPFQELPLEQKFDAVVCMDVLEHCPAEDIPWILEEMFSFAEKLVISNVACYPASKRLPNGENAHCTIRDVEWWEDIIDRVAENHPNLKWHFWFVVPGEGAESRRLEEAVYSNVFI